MTNECPFEMYEPEINESRCSIPLEIPPIATYGIRVESWLCIYRGKYGDCPILSKTDKCEDCDKIDPEDVPDEESIREAMYERSINEGDD